MPTYPDELWPADSTILDVDGTTDVLTGLPFIPKGTGPTSSPSYEIQYNRRQMRQNLILAPWRQGTVVDEGSLRIGVYPIEYTLGGQRKSFAGLTGMSVLDNGVRVVYLDASAAVQVAAAWPADLGSYLPLAEITTAGGAMNVVDRRTWSAFQAAVNRRYLSAVCSQVGSNQSALKVFECDPAQDLVLEEVQVFCTATAATASLDVRKSGASMLSAPATPIAGSLVKPAIADAALSASTNVTVNVTTNGAGSISNLQVILVLCGG
jgi:hypothetical protein